MGSYLMYVDATVDETGVVYYRDSDNAGIKGERVMYDDPKKTPGFKFKPDDYLVVRNVRTDEPIVVKGDVLQAAIDKAEDGLKHMSKEQMAETFMTLNDVLKNEYMKSWIGSPKWGDVGYGHNHDTVILNVWKDVSDKGRVAIRTSDNHNLRPFTGKIHRGMVVVGNEYVVPEKDNLVIRDVVTGEPETISVRELTESCESRYMHDWYWDKADDKYLENYIPSMNRDPEKIAKDESLKYCLICRKADNDFTVMNLFMRNADENTIYESKKGDDITTVQYFDSLNEVADALKKIDYDVDGTKPLYQACDRSLALTNVGTGPNLKEWKPVPFDDVKNSALMDIKDLNIFDENKVLKAATYEVDARETLASFGIGFKADKETAAYKSDNTRLGGVVAKSNKEILHEHTNYNLPKRSHESVRDFADVTAAGDDNFQKGLGE